MASGEVDIVTAAAALARSPRGPDCEVAYPRRHAHARPKTLLRPAAKSMCHLFSCSPVKEKRGNIIKMPRSRNTRVFYKKAMLLSLLRPS